MLFLSVQVKIFQLMGKKKKTFISTYLSENILDGVLTINISTSLCIPPFFVRLENNDLVQQ